MKTIVCSWHNLTSFLSSSLPPSSPSSSSCFGDRVWEPAGCFSAWLEELPKLLQTFSPPAWPPPLLLSQFVSVHPRSIPPVTGGGGRGKARFVAGGHGAEVRGLPVSFPPASPGQVWRVVWHQPRRCWFDSRWPTFLSKLGAETSRCECVLRRWKEMWKQRWLGVESFSKKKNA